MDSRAQTWEVGGAIGGAGYMGDLNPDNPLDITGVSISTYGKLNLDPHWAIGLHYSYGKVKANDATSANSHFRQRNLNFKSPLNELTLQIDFNFFDYFAGGGRKRFSPYVYTGAGVVFFSPKAEHNGEEYELPFYRTEGQTFQYRRYAVTIPYGVGVRTKVTENWGLFAQIGYRTAYTDYIDDVSKSYPDKMIMGKNVNLSNPSYSFSVGEPGVQRGDFRKRDTYMFVGIGISYTFVSQKCYTF